MPKIINCLWFDKEGEEAANFYVNVFKGGGRKAKLGNITYYTKASEAVSGKPAGSVCTIEFELEGQRFMALNGGPVFKLTPAVSFIVNCKNQEEVDYFWNKMSAVKEAEQCGWIQDKFGVSWQIVPEILEKLLADKDKVKSERVMSAMLPMHKLDIKTLKQAYEG